MTTMAAAMLSANVHASQKQSPAASPRRVLGELTANTQLTPKHAHLHAKSPSANALNQSPLKAQDALPSSLRLTEKENGSVVSGITSRKRPYPFTESPCKRDPMRSPAKRQHEMRVETVSPALLRSTVPPPVVIELVDDELNTDDNEPREVLNNHSNDHCDRPLATEGTTGSFSSLVDYNPSTASDESEVAQGSSASSQSIPVMSRAELLRLRLKMAMYKINTNQTLVPFADLEVPHARTIDGENVEEEDKTTSPEAHQADLHENCDAPANIVIKGGPIGKLLAAPIFPPTAFSSRFIEGPDASNSRSRHLLAYTTMGHVTPATSPTRLSARNERALTSSVVKTHAATGLLELAHAV